MPGGICAMQALLLNYSFRGRHLPDPRNGSLVILRGELAILLTFFSTASNDHDSV